MLEFVEVHCESIEILPDFHYTWVSDYLSQLGTYSSKAEGTIQDVSVRSHWDGGHLNEHTETQQTQGSILQKDHPNLFRSSTRIAYPPRRIDDHGTLEYATLLLTKPKLHLYAWFVKKAM